MIARPPPTACDHPGPVGYYSQSLSTLIMTLLAVIVSVAAYGIFSVVRGAPATSQYVAWAACAMLVVTAFVMLLVARITAARSMSLIVEQLHALSLSDTFSQAQAAWPGDLNGVLSALSAYVDQVRARMAQLHLQKKQLDIQMRAATAERSNAEAIILSISEAVIVIDSLGQLTLANAAAEALFSFRFADWRHRPIDRLLTDASLVDILRDTRLFDGSSNRRQVEYGIVCSGQTQTFNIMLSPGD